MNNQIEILSSYIETLIHDKIGIIHLYGVAQNCALISMKRNENTELAIMAGMLHDLSSYTTGNPINHAHKSSVLAREILTKLQLTNKEETDLICLAILNHSNKDKTYDSFSEILIDADVLQHYLYSLQLPIKKYELNRLNKILKELNLLIENNNHIT